MKRLILLLALAVATIASSFAQNEQQLRIFIRAGAKTHGPNQHDHPRFLKEWTQLLTERGAKVDGALEFPTKAQLEASDVLVMYAAEAGTIKGEQRQNLEAFLKRGGGIVVIHDAACGTEHEYYKTIVGGAWEHKHSKWLEGEVGVYFLDTEHPITKGASNFDLKDEIYYDMHMMPDAKVLATSFHSVFVIGPQMWTYEKTLEGGQPYRSFVTLQGHEWSTFELPHFRALLLRGIAWAGKRQNVDQLCRPEELASLKYPPGGPTAPEKAAAKLNVHPDFDINLVASEPLMEKAISLDWDPQGRLWVAETPEYPNGRNINANDAVLLMSKGAAGQLPPGGKEDRPARDRISWLEDTNGDGTMDKKHVFADGLELVTSLVFYKDGVIVAQAPDILWLRDTNGDGKCDMQSEKVTLFTGFGTFDTHAVINNMRWGFDGWIYSAVGYSAGQPKSADGSTDFGRVTAGIFRFKPDGSALEQVASGSCNTWGFDIAPDGELFFTTATCGEHFLHIVMPEKAVARGNVGGVRSFSVLPDHQDIFPAVHHTRPAYVQIDWVGKFTAAAGSCVYNGGAWPDKYNGSHFLSETTMSLVHNDWITPKGPTFVAGKEPGREQSEFIAGSDLWFRPVHSRVGPDGALYVVDFYNQAAIHNDTRGPKHGVRNAAVRPDRDHHFGRIWRVQHKQARKFDRLNLNGGQTAELVKALEHPNGWTRATAHRLLLEKNDAAAVEPLKTVLKSSNNSFARVHAVRLLAATGKLDDATLAAAVASPDNNVKKNALRVVSEGTGVGGSEVRGGALRALQSPEARIRLDALLALQALTPDEEIARAVVAAYPSLEDRWAQSAALGVANKDLLLFTKATLASQANADRLREFIGLLGREVGLRGDAALALSFVQQLGASKAEALQVAGLNSLTAALKPDVTPSSSAREALGALLGSQSENVRGAALPLVARWDRNGELAAQTKPVIEQLYTKLNDKSLYEDFRGQIAVNLLGVRQLAPDAITKVAALLGGEASVPLQRRVVEALGNVPDAAAGAALVRAFPNLAPELQEVAFGQLVRRSDSSLTLLASVEKGEIPLTTLGPASIHRLRTHSDDEVAKRAIAVVEKIRGPQAKQKDALIETLLPTVETAGNIQNGKMLYTANCANCHKYKGEGRDLAPDLTGMGAHGAHDLLVHIVDPNRVVEPNFVSVTVEKKDDESIDGVLASENEATIKMRNASGDFEIRKSEVKSRRSNGISLMPEGFEALGGEGLRDLIAYLTMDENKYRIIDLSSAFTANSTRGIYGSQERANESLRFRTFGLNKVEGIPFEVLHPSRTPNGNNVIVLKGGQGFSKTLPQKVEVNTGVTATKLHFLGGVGGWAFPCCGDDKKEGEPVAKVTLHFASGAKQEIVLKNGVEFADYNGRAEVPGSKEAVEVVRYGQIRWFTKPVEKTERIQRITIESYNNQVAPTFVAITAELAAQQTAAKQ
ncbi:MAG TPA: PVC-type heme-binding CxxCH protein [Methylomirabilota bacterium]|nr:PVC-type heme-binding CxxCH protein [Methylomirabilota bacterium]